MNPNTAARNFNKAVNAAGGLWTAHDMAEAAGCSEQAIYDRLKRGTLPPPVMELGRLRVWLGAQLPDELRQARRQGNAGA